MPITVNNPDIAMHGFVVTRWAGRPRNLEPAEHDDLRWFRPEDLPGLVMADAASLADILDAIRGAAQGRRT